LTPRDRGGGNGGDFINAEGNSNVRPNGMARKTVGNLWPRAGRGAPYLEQGFHNLAGGKEGSSHKCSSKKRLEG